MQPFLLYPATPETDEIKVRAARRPNGIIGSRSHPDHQDPNKIKCSFKLDFYRSRLLVSIAWTMFFAKTLTLLSGRIQFRPTRKDSGQVTRRRTDGSPHGDASSTARSFTGSVPRAAR